MASHKHAPVSLNKPANVGQIAAFDKLKTIAQAAYNVALKISVYMEDSLSYRVRGIFG